MRDPVKRFSNHGLNWRLKHGHTPFLVSSTLLKTKIVTWGTGTDNGPGAVRVRTIQVLEFFDRVGYTRRVREAHRLRNADMFGRTEHAA